MRELSLFAGAGGGILGGYLLGWRCVCAVEQEPYRCLCLAQRQNDGILEPFPIWCGDIADFDGREWRGRVDVVSGGFPCQDISAANPDAEGITGARSSLWKEQLRILREIGEGEPRGRKPILLVENSPMLTSRGLGTVLGDLAALGYDARWGVLGADDVGGFHIRKRLFLVGYADRARLEGFAWNGDRDGGSEAVGHAAKAGVRLLADAGSSLREGWASDKGREPEQRTAAGGSGPAGINVADAGRIPEGRASGSDREEERGQASEPSGRSDALADSDGPRQHEPQGHGGNECLWSDAEFIRCEDGKIRATKPGVCGMADELGQGLDLDGGAISK